MVVPCFDFVIGDAEVSHLGGSQQGQAWQRLNGVKRASEVSRNGLKTGGGLTISGLHV